MKWDVKQIFEDHGGANDLHAKLVANGHTDLTVRAVRQWLRRDNIKAEWMAAVIMCSDADPRKWIIGQDEPEPEIEDIF